MKFVCPRFISIFLTIVKFQCSLCGQGERLLCIGSNIAGDKVPRKHKACSVVGERMLVTKILLKEYELTETCFDSGGNYINKGIPLNLTIANHKLKAMEIRKACNGQLQCDVPSSPLLVPLKKMMPTVYHYESFIVIYECLPFETGNIVDISQNITKIMDGSTTTYLVLKNNNQSKRQCSIRSKQGLELRPLWIDFGNKSCYGNFLLILGNQTKDIKCNDMEKILKFTDKVYRHNSFMEFQVIGSSEIVWLNLSANDRYSINCSELHAAYSFKITSVGTKSTHPPVTTAGSGSGVISPRNNQTLNVSETGGSHELTIICTSVLTVITTLVAVILLVYVCYIRKNSPYQRRKSTRRLLKQRQEQEQQQGRQQRQIYDEYTYVDESQISSSNEDRGCQKGPEVAKENKTAASSPRTPVGYYIVEPGAYSLTYSSTEAGQSVYNHLSENNHSKKTDCNPQLYDTTEATGEYSHFDDTDKHRRVLCNVYDEFKSPRVNHTSNNRLDEMYEN